jgi:signal transduction histidine kinase
VLVAASLLALGARLLVSARATRIARALLVATVLWPASWAGVAQTGSGPFLSWVAGNVVWVVLGTGLLSYPDQQRRSTAERRFLVCMWSFTCVGLVVVALLSRPEWDGRPAGSAWPTVVDDRGLFVVLTALFAVGRVGLAVWGTLLLVARLRSASGLDRSLLSPTVAGVLLLVLVVNVTGVVQTTRTEESAQLAALLGQAIVLLALPVAVVVAALRMRLARAEMSGLMAAQDGPAGAASVQAALRRALHDDSLRVLFRLPGVDALVDDAGRQVRPPPASAACYCAPLVDSSGHQLGLVTGEPRLRDHQQLVQVAVEAAARELEFGALQAGLHTQMEQLRVSRDEVVAAGRDERRRLLRDLHDGAQQRLLGIALRIEHVHHRTRDPELQEHLGIIKSQLHLALVEVRDLAHGLQPGVLVQAGLAPALRALTDGLPIAVHIDIPEERYSQHAESTLFFVANEALSNVVKHARAAHAGVTLCQVGDRLRIEVTDDGVGVGSERGAGLRGLADRVHALGGELTVSGEPGRGTSVVAMIPCG